MRLFEMMTVLPSHQLSEMLLFKLKDILSSLIEIILT